MKKHILITGSTDGIGKDLAKRLAKEGHYVYIHGRNLTKLNDTISELKSDLGNIHLKGFIADFSDVNSVKNMASQIKSEHITLDILINNAGVYNSPIKLNNSGIDLRFAVNYLAPVVLTEKLLPLMNKEGGSRIINLSSAAQAPISYDLLWGRNIGENSETYAQSKLALTMWSFYLAKQLKDISVTAVNPGSLLNTKMVKEAFGKHWSPASKGVDVLYNLSMSEAYNGVTGKYFDNDLGQFGNAHPEAYKDEEIDRLIKETQSILTR